MKKLTLEEWDDRVGRHLRMIEAGAEICENHARQLLGMPDFELRVTDSMERAGVILGMIVNALARLEQAKANMREKNRVA
jgi:hypothetical protein